MPFRIRDGFPLLTAFYAFFMLFMRKTTFFRFNRIVLLAGTAVCMLLPLIKLNIGSVAAMLGLHAPDGVLQLPRIFLPEVLVTGNPSGEMETGGSLNWSLLLTAIYVTGCTAALTFPASSLLRILRIIMKNPGTSYRECKVHTTASATHSFSFMNHIVMSRSDYGNHPEILLHEYMHTRLRHSVDVLFMSLVCALYWFNPLVWIMLSELRMLHEYETDEAVLKHGIDATQYQLLLVRKAVGDRRFLIANSFNHCKLKNRITMMQKLKTSKWARLAYIACLPLFVLILSSSSAVESHNPIPEMNAATAAEPTMSTPDSQQKTIDYADVPVKPKFNDGNINDFTTWVCSHLEYPQEARKAKISGRVTVQFTINTDGSLSDIHILRGVNELLDNEVLRVISQSPAWTPGYVDGKPVAVCYAMPVIFQLPNE